MEQVAIGKSEGEKAGVTAGQVSMVESQKTRQLVNQEQNK